MLTISSVTASDQGNYKIIAKNKMGERSCQAKVTVKEVLVAPLFITKPDEVISIIEGDDATLNVEVEGLPVPKITWKLSSMTIKNSEDHTLAEENRILTIKNMSGNLSGTYMCIAENKAGKASTTSKVEMMKNPNDSIPIFAEKLEDITFIEGQDIQLKVAVDGSPTPEVSFYKDGKILRNLDGIVVENTVDHVWETRIELATIEVLFLSTNCLYCQY